MTINVITSRRFLFCAMGLIFLSFLSLSSTPSYATETSDFVEFKVRWANNTFTLTGTKDGNSIAGDTAWFYELKRGERVKIEVEATHSSALKLGIDYEVRGRDHLAKFASAWQKDYAPPAGVVPTKTTQQLVVTEDLIPGGELAFKITLLETGRKVDELELIFKVKYTPPPVFVSFGMAFTGAKQKELKLIQLVAKDTVYVDSQQVVANKRRILLEDSGDALNSLSPITFFNVNPVHLFRPDLNCPLYLSFGKPLTGNFANEWALGGTLYRDYGSVGVAITGGIHVTRELAISEDWDKSVGDIVGIEDDITEENIPTVEKRRTKCFVGIHLTF